LSAILQYGNFFSSWQWEWFPTLTSREPVSLDAARRQLLHWNRNLCTSEGIQTAFIAVSNSTTFTPHLHVLMFGKNKYGRTLLDISTGKWERKWPGIARIEIFRDNQAVSKYLARNMTFWDSDQYDLITCNQKLLMKEAAGRGSANSVIRRFHT